MKVAVCLPYYADMRGQFTVSLAELMISACRVGVPYGGKQVQPDLALFDHSTSLVARNRQKIAERAKAAGSDFLLWLDSDHQFPNNTLAQLFLHMADSRVSVVGCNYPRRERPTGPTAINLASTGPEPVYTTREKADAGLVEQVDSMGFGILLMRASVLDLIPPPWFSSHDEMGEDGYFFHRLRAKGVRPFVDHALSWKTRHLAVLPVTNEDAETDRGQWSPPRS